MNVACENMAGCRRFRATVQALSYRGDVGGRPRQDRADSARTLVTALLYADDAAVLGSPHDMVHLLALAEQHSMDKGYRWHPHKCAIIQPPAHAPPASSTAQSQEQVYMIYNTPIPTVQSFQYLVIPFTSEGIDANMLINQRISKATGSMALLRQLGVHQYYIGLWPAIRTYRCFVRPVLEYGLAITAMSAVQMDKLQKAQLGCIKMALNRNTSTTFPTIVPMVLADISTKQLRTRTLQLKFVTRLQSLPVSTMARAVELSILWAGRTKLDSQWRKIKSTNPLHQHYNKLRSKPNPPRNPIAEAIAKKRDDEFASRCNKYKTVRCLRPYRIVDPILYLAASSKDRHRLIKWRMHWLPSYPLKDCERGAASAPREHYATCPSLRPWYQELLVAFGTILELPPDAQALDHILNCLPRSDVGLTRGKWKAAWPALLHVLRRIDRLSDEALQSRAPPPTTEHHE